MTDQQITLRAPNESGSTTRLIANMTLMRLNVEELPQWVELMHGLGVDECVAEPVEDMPMQAIYLDAHAAG